MGQFSNENNMPSFSTNNAFVNIQPAPIRALSDDLNDVRLVVKDLFHIQGLPTAAGNPTWLATHTIPDTSNSSVVKLLSMGAKYLGKTLTDELAYSLNGQNIHYGALVNPITPERFAGGSSSGSANAVAAEHADIGLGTDTGGSIRVPASYNGLFGLRTSHGAIACDNMVALAPSFDTVGWVSSNIENLERIARCLLPNEQNKNEHSQSSLVALTNLIDNAEQASGIYAWLNQLTSIDYSRTQFDVDSLHTSETFRVLQGYEIWQQHGQWITQHEPFFADDIHARFMWCKNLTNAQFMQAKQQQKVVKLALMELLARNSILVIPTTPGCAPLLSDSVNNMARYREDLMGLTAIAGLAGLPQIHLPLFKIAGAPCGVSLIGNKNTDLRLIALARKLLLESEPQLSNTEYK